MRKLLKQQAVDFIMQEKIIAICRHVGEEKLLKTMEVFLQAGIKVAEVTMNTTGALEILKRLDQEFGDRMLLGAGTVTSPREVEEAVLAGARLIVCPNTVPQVISTCRDLDVVCIPGALTPTEITWAYDLGADMVKVFPVSTFGPGYIKEIRGPLNHIPLAAVGGINLENGRSFLQAGAVALGIGSSLVSQQLIDKGLWEELGSLAVRYKAIAAG
ncbi:MAG: bifunctional 4-hydroxy-2-oxoglutarate aldolase/2-dehydro-3-deoxy-phosphogluconate aldolase [Bacillota bacterium]